MPNCSLEILNQTGTTVFSGLGCPEAAVICGMNISWLLSSASEDDLKEMCLSEEEYLTTHMGPRMSPWFLPVCITYLIIFLVGVLGNSFTCAVILQHSVMQTATNYYLLSLAVSDLLVLLLGMPLEVYEMQQNYPFLLGKGGCYFKIFLFETVCFASILNVTALSVERYVAVTEPLKVKHMATRAHARRVIFMLWGLSMLCALPNTSVHGIKVLPPRLRREKLMATMDANHSFGPGIISKSHRQRLTKRNLQVTKMLCVLVVVFGLCWAPFHVDRLMWSYIDKSSIQHQKIFEKVHIVSGVFFYLSSAVNPILYNLMSTRFREMFSHLTCCSKGWPARFGFQMTQRSTLSKENDQHS